MTAAPPRRPSDDQSAVKRGRASCNRYDPEMKEDRDPLPRRNLDKEYKRLPKARHGVLTGRLALRVNDAHCHDTVICGKPRRRLGREYLRRTDRARDNCRQRTDGSCPPTAFEDANKQYSLFELELDLWLHVREDTTPRHRDRRTRRFTGSVLRDWLTEACNSVSVDYTPVKLWRAGYATYHAPSSHGGPGAAERLMKRDFTAFSGYRL